MPHVDNFKIAGNEGFRDKMRGGRDWGEERLNQAEIEINRERQTKMEAETETGRDRDKQK